MEFSQLAINHDGPTGIVEMIHIAREIEHLVGNTVDYFVVESRQEVRSLLEDLGPLVIIRREHRLTAIASCLAERCGGQLG
jgi:hypothetical protein